PLRPLPSFPTRRSSDLRRLVSYHAANEGLFGLDYAAGVRAASLFLRAHAREYACGFGQLCRVADPHDRRGLWAQRTSRNRHTQRSEEHTSELQSRENLV